MAATGNTSPNRDDQVGLKDRVVSAIIIGVIRLLTLLPYRMRVPASGWVLSSIVGPLIGYRQRVRDNLSLIFPDMPAAEKERLARAVPDQIGRTLAELFSPKDLIRTAAETPVAGAGVAAVEEARQAGRPIILVSGHFGNYDIARSVLIQRGHKVGGLYRAMNYRGFNDFYVSRIAQVGTPLFLRGRRGMGEMVKFLKAGNAIALLIDQHMSAGAPLTFFGQTAYTALSAAELALRYDALLVPCYGVRQPDGLSFEMVIEAPVPHSTPEEMTQALNDSLEAQVRAHMAQWLWVHRRWKSA
ncbi:lysophospholipid acyltransferase family protein [Roseobacter sinensis]|uniref:Lysophospholipid acyltransferase family protein n=1 Tax=Roseobacter sinensis TaxID=2931391 RepID=A0ABT3BDP2_9RHOB|nr:lysophospholipid acyltransferase family protein [Roseobacter sp. WL0113]MCV3271693.1 lysophospholipid acyltransferase family protein [Roseobacter sp. WL0113]